ncbi:MAG TPA: porin, partial [Burkholderiales bacterium]|nr:porin [Burkholderiales bacterium]
GFLKMSLEQYKLGNSNKSPSSQGLLADDSSRVIFNMVEDLGGGLQAIGQVDIRVTMDAGADAANGNNHVGLRSKQWGRIFFGRQDLHYFGRESDLTVKNDLKADSISLLAFTAGGQAIAGATRTTNVVHYTTPNWGGFSAVLAYSFNPTAVETDINSGIRRGRAWNVAPTFEARNFTIGYSYWSQKADGATQAVVPAAAVASFPNSDQRGDRLFGSYRWGGFRIGAAWDKSKVKNGVTGVESARRTVWSLPIEYSWGPHWIGGHFTKARDDKATVVQDGARMWALGYNYSLSKRTSVGVTYASIRNDVGAAYAPFTSTGGLGSPSNTPAAGEDPRLWSMTIKHSF